MDNPSEGPRWASTDLRWRGSSASSTPHDPRGFVEDSGDRNQRGFIRGPRLWFFLWRNKGICFSITPLISAIAVASCLLSMELHNDWLVTLAGTTTICNAFLLLFQRRRLRKLGTLRNQNNDLRKKVYYMRQERERLRRTLSRLDEQVADMYSIPKELHQLSKNRDVDRLISIVNEQKSIQEKIRNQISQQVMQQILSLVVKEDRDRNMTLKPTEVEKLIVRLGLLQNIEFDEQRFRKMLTDDPSVTSVMEIIRSLLEKDDEYEHGSPVIRVIT